MVNVTPDTIKKHAGGRPSRWSIATAKRICNWVRKGIPLRYASPLVGIPWHTAKEWVGKYPEFAPMLEEAHSFFVTSHVQNIERHSKMSEKPSQWLLERRAKDEFSPAYTQNPSQQGTLNVLALGNDALGKLMQGWSGMIGGEMKQAEVVEVGEAIEQSPNTQPIPSLLAEDITISKTPPQAENLPQVSEVILPAEEKQALPVEEVKVKRGRGRPRKYPKPDGGGTPPTPPTP